MEEKKNNKGLVWLIVILIILVLGLVGYIIYDRVLSDEEITINNNGTTSTTESIKNSKSDRTKITHITLNENEKIENDWIEESMYSKNFIINFKENKIDLQFTEDIYINVKLNNIKIGNFENYGAIDLIQNYKNYIFIYNTCHCGAAEANSKIAINIETEEMFKIDCFPNENGVCEYQKYENIIENQYNDTIYTVDYTNDAKKTINKQEKFNCDNYMKDYNMEQEIDTLINKDCNNDNTCVERIYFCNDYNY